MKRIVVLIALSLCACVNWQPPASDTPDCPSHRFCDDCAATPGCVFCPGNLQCNPIHTHCRSTSGSELPALEDPTSCQPQWTQGGGGDAGD